MKQRRNAKTFEILLLALCCGASGVIGGRNRGLGGPRRPIMPPPKPCLMRYTDDADVPMPAFAMLFGISSDACLSFLATGEWRCQASHAVCPQHNGERLHLTVSATSNTSNDNKEQQVLLYTPPPSAATLTATESPTSKAAPDRDAPPPSCVGSPRAQT